MYKDFDTVLKHRAIVALRGSGGKAPVVILVDFYTTLKQVASLTL